MVINDASALAIADVGFAMGAAVRMSRSRQRMWRWLPMT